MLRTIITIAACVLVLAVGAGLYFAMDYFKPTPPKVESEVRLPLIRVAEAEKQDRRIDVSTQGTVTPRTEIQLVAQVGGTVTSIAPTMVNGGFFEKNDILVQIDPRDYEFEVTRAEAQVAQAKLRISRELAEAEIARQEWQAVGKGDPTPLTLREPQLLEARAGLKAAEAMLAKAALALSRTKIRAPFAGRVRQKSADAGQFVGPGQAVARIYAVDFVEIRLPLHDGKLAFLDLPLSFRGSDGSQPQPAVTLRANFAGTEHEWTGTIVRTEGEIDPKSRMVHAVARVTDPYGRGGKTARPPLAVGMFVDATIHGREFAGVVELPRIALREGSRVLVVDAEDRLYRRAVEVLFANADSVILAKGVQPGERVCLSPMAVVFDGMQVQIAAEAEK